MCAWRCSRSTPAAAAATAAATAATAATTAADRRRATRRALGAERALADAPPPDIELRLDAPRELSACACRPEP